MFKTKFFNQTLFFFFNVFELALQVHDFMLEIGYELLTLLTLAQGQFRLIA